jgi:hypothetical protein
MLCRVRRSVVLLLLALVVAACSSRDPAELDPIPAAPGAVGTSPGVALTESDLFCPPQRPKERYDCTLPGSSCEYGGSPDLTCDAIVDCAGIGVGRSVWTSRAPNSACVPHDCPRSFGDIVVGSPCEIDVDGGPAGDDAEYLCGYDQGTCGCTTGPDGAHAHARNWQCAAPPGFSRCPNQRPSLGAPCDVLGVTCDYGSCDFKHGTAVKCASNHWVAVMIACP